MSIAPVSDTATPAEPAAAVMHPLAAFVAMFRRELLLAVRRPGDMLTPLFFFIVIGSLFPLAVSPVLDVLRVLGPGVVWVAALLAALLPLNGLFSQDFDDGSLEQYLLCGQSLAMLCAAKSVASWMVSGLPLVLVSPLLMTSFGIGPEALPTTLVALGLGTFSLSALGGAAAALTVGVRRANALISLLILPLMTPILIFGARAVSLAAVGEFVAGPLYWLAAIAVASGVLAPLAAAAALRISVD
jgi:heme exporter protein B